MHVGSTKGEPLTGGTASVTTGTALRALKETVIAMVAPGPAFARWVAAVVIVAGLCASGIVASAYGRRNAERLTLELNAQTRFARDAISVRIKGYEKGIRGTRGAILVGGQENITADTYRIYAESRDPAVEFPGARGFGFIRREGSHYQLRFMSPRRGNTDLIGLDIAADAAQREAVDAAMRSGVATMTGPLEPSSDKDLSAQWFLVVLPIYRPDVPRHTPAQRDAATLGWAFAALDLAGALRGIDVPDDLELSLSDVTSAAVPKELETINRLQTPPAAALLQPQILNLYGREWAFTARAGTRFAARLNPTAPSRVLTLGSILTLLASGLAAALTAHLRGRTAFRAQQDLLANVVADASDAIILESLEGVVLSWNSAAEQLFGFSAEEAIGRRPVQLALPAERAHEESDLLARCAQGLRVPSFDTVRCRRDGSLLDVSVAAMPVMGAKGCVLAVSKTIRDISERKATESKFKHDVQSLEREVGLRSERRQATEHDLRTITDAMPSLIGYWDRNLISRFANYSYQTFFGIDSQALSAIRMQDLLGLELFERNRPFVEAALKGEAVTFEREMHKKDNPKPVTMLVNYMPEVTDGEVRGFYVMLHDITDLKEAQRRLAESERFLERAEAMSGVGGFRIDLKSGVQWWTKQTFKIHELDADVAPTLEEIDQLMTPDPTLGAITPSEFIPIAEESHLIVALGQWVQKQACQAMLSWRQLDPERAPRTISVNVSRAELALGQQFIDQVSATLERTGLPAKCLQLEVTEREVMRQPEAARAALQQLQSLGVQLAMDDFGTGTSSLGFLHNYPFNTIKIDRSFVQDVTGQGGVLAVIHATINLVENLGMVSLAEGVEELAQVAILQSLGCRYAQGYFFSRPVAAELLLDAVGSRTAVSAGHELSETQRATTLTR